ncbi:nitric oxide reductase activation protein NorD [Noviherbaspirillum cavernae]|nr:VWA domain-containing protein [Noviherbaspirillum cavernae]
MTPSTPGIMRKDIDRMDHANDGSAALDPAWSLARTAWMADGATQLVPLVEQKLHALGRRLNADEFAALIELLDSLKAVTVTGAAQVINRLEFLLDRVNVDGLGRWILTGLRMHPADPGFQERYLSLDDAASVAALAAEEGAQAPSACFPALAYYLNGLAESPLDIQARRQTILNGPPARPVITDTALLLPDSYTILDGEDRAMLYRAAVAHAVAHIRHSPRKLPTAGLKPLGIAVVSTIEDARAERLLLREYPGLANLFLPFLRKTTHERDLGFAWLAVRLHHALLDPGYQDDNYWVNKGRRLFEENAGELDDYQRFREIASILANDLGQMRVRFNAQQYAVSPAYCDDNSCLWDYAGSSAPAPMEQDIEVKGARLEQAEAAPDATPVSVEAATSATFSYPEWDYRINACREGWCTVVERADGPRLASVRSAGESPATAPRIAMPKSARSGQIDRHRRLRRQWEGEEIDLNAAIEFFVDRRRHASPESRVFMRPGRREHRTAILVLMDLSESANDRIPGRFDSILDMEKKAAWMLAQAVADSDNRLAIHGFCSNTRHEVNYTRFIEFGEVVGAPQQKAIARASAAYSTRMGAALRHAAALLDEEDSERKVVIMVTDGAPSDIDVFDDEYLILDAQAGVNHARQHGVDCFCLTIDADAERYVKRIFGAKNYRIVDDPLSLPAQLSGVFAHINGL